MHSFKPDGESKLALDSQKDTDVTITKVKGFNIKTVKIPPSSGAVDLKPQPIKNDPTLNYTELKSKITSNNENSRFQLSELARVALSVDKEEEYRIEVEVQKRVRSRLDEVYKKALDDAYEKGFSQGKTDGHKEILENMAPIVQHFETLIESFDRAAIDVYKANEEFIVKMIYSLVRKIVLKELKEDKEYIARCVQNIIEMIGSRENIKLFIPLGLLEDAELIKEGIQKQLGALKNFTVEVDPQLTQGGCRVETDFGDVDASIEAQFEKLDALFQQVEGQNA